MWIYNFFFFKGFGQRVQKFVNSDNWGWWIIGGIIMDLKKVLRKLGVHWCALSKPFTTVVSVVFTYLLYLKFCSRVLKVSLHTYNNNFVMIIKLIYSNIFFYIIQNFFCPKLYIFWTNHITKNNYGAQCTNSYIRKIDTIMAPYFWATHV